MDHVAPKPREKTRRPRVGVAVGPRWEFYSRFKRSVDGRGFLLLDHLILLECEPTLTVYEPFPKLTVEINGEPHTSVAASLATYRNGSRCLSSIQYNEHTDASASHRWLVEKTWAKANGCTHQELTAQAVRSGDLRLFNSRTLFPWLAELHEPSPAATRAAIGALTLKPGVMTIADLAEIVALPLEITMAIVARSFVSRIVTIEHFSTRPLGYGSKVGSLASRPA